MPFSNMDSSMSDEIFKDDPLHTPQPLSLNDCCSDKKSSMETEKIKEKFEELEIDEDK